jgi:hypothetical protein
MLRAPWAASVSPEHRRRAEHRQWMLMSQELEKTIGPTLGLPMFGDSWLLQSLGQAIAHRLRTAQLCYTFVQNRAAHSHM